MKKIILGFAVISLFGSEPSGFAQLPLRSEVERLLHRSGAEMNVFVLDEMGLRTSQTPNQPWTSSYWPDAIGGIATRYRKNNSSTLDTWFGLLANFDLNKKKWKNNNQKMKEKVLGMNELEIAEELSPSEKYDLLMGDLNFSLTNRIIDEIDFRYHNKPNPQTGYWVPSKGLASWNGICDGWTAASLHLPRPVKTIRVRGGTGQVVTFYPDDLKALASHLFARSNQWLNIERAGNRCRDRKPVTDRTGRPLKDECRDIDAGLWHATVLNRIGIDQRGFVIDVDNNTTVNNHPVFGYDVFYFNPLTGRYGTLYESVVPLNQVRDGKESIRHPKATQLVGIEMQLDVLDYDWPTGKEYDGPEFDQKKRKIHYAYDLELNEAGEILGGQFRSSGKKIEKQPDMMWMLAKYQIAWSRSSIKADEGSAIDSNQMELWGNMNWRFKGDGTIPKDWFEAHLESSRFILPEAHPWSMIGSAAPLAEMVYYLFDRARE